MRARILKLKILLKSALKNPFRIPRWIYSVIFARFRGRVPFTSNQVVGGWTIKGAGLPHFSSRLYNELKLLNEALGVYRAKRSLEIGCGYGRLTPWISDHSDVHYAIEPEAVLLSFAKELYPNINFNKAKAQKLPFPDNYFDLCVSWTVLQHIPSKSELIKAINEIKRVCAKNSIIILAEGVGNVKLITYNEYTIEEWIDFFKPWKLSWSKEKKIENTVKGELVMKFTWSNN